MSRIEALIGIETLPEKLGQSPMNAAGYAVTGPSIDGDSADAFKAGTIGSLLNMVAAVPCTRDAAEFAKESAADDLAITFAP